MCSYAFITLLKLSLCLLCPSHYALFYSVFPDFFKPNEYFSFYFSFAWFTCIVLLNTAYFVWALLFVHVSLIKLWILRLEGLCLPASSFPPSLLFLFCISSCLYPFLPLFLPHSLSPPFYYYLFDCLSGNFSSFNVAEPECRLKADQLQRYLWYAVLSSRKENITKCSPR